MDGIERLRQVRCATQAGTIQANATQTIATWAALAEVGGFPGNGCFLPNTGLLDVDQLPGLTAPVNKADLTSGPA